MTPPGTIRDVLRWFGLTASVDRVEEQTAGFSGSSVSRVRLADGSEFAVRGTPANDLPADRLRGLHRLLAHVRSEGVTTVAVPLARDGETLRLLADRRWQVEPWLPGRPVLSEAPTPEAIAAACTELARWHDALGSFVPTPAEARWFPQRASAPSPAVTERLKRLGEWRTSKAVLVRNAIADRDEPFDRLAREVLAGLERHGETIEQELRSALGGPFRLQPCLRDVHAGHVLFDGGRVTGIIDPSACRSDSIAVDLARLLGDVDLDDEAVWANGVEAYRRCRALGPGEADLARILARSAVVLTGTTWLDRCYLRRLPVDRDPWVVRRLERLVDRLRRLPTA